MAQIVSETSLHWLGLVVEGHSMFQHVEFGQILELEPF